MAKVEKWIVKNGIHMGLIKYTVSTGAIIEHDIENQKLIIDGVAYSPTKDLDILKRHGYVELYNEEVKQEISKKAEKEQKAEEKRMKKLFENKNVKSIMPVVQSDEDMQSKEIDISYTRKQKPHKVEISNDLEVIRADETLEERVARKQSSIPKMPVVKDDSLGSINGNSRNINAKVEKSKEEYERVRQENFRKAKEAEERLKKEWEVKTGKVTENTDDIQTIMPKEIDVKENNIPDSDTVKVKKKRGRPRKEKSIEEKPKKKRGRPAKKKETVETTQEG